MKLLDIKLIAIIIGIIIFCSNIHLRSKVSKLDNELADAKNNIEYYQNKLSYSNEDNRVLRLKLEDFRHSNDSVIETLNQVRDSLKIKEKQLKQIASAETVIRDTIVEKIPTERDFCVELKPNALTTIKVTRTDSILECIPEIHNRQDLFVYRRKVYRNKYKNWFIRFIHFDFKKDEIEEYKITNTNSLIQVLDTRVINISD